MARPHSARRHPVGRPLGRPSTRLGTALGGVGLVLLAFIGRLVWLQGLQAPAYAAEAQAQRLRSTTHLAARGTITDRNGHPLALSVDARAIYAEPKTIAAATCQAESTTPCTPATIAAALAPILRLPATELTKKLTRRSAFVYLARGVDPAVANRVREAKLIGIGVLPEPKRVHPGGTLAASVLGFTDVDGKGAAGLEFGLDKVLAGKNGVTTAEVDRAGRLIPSGQKKAVAPVPGANVELTLDRDLQWYAQELLAAKVQETQAINGTVVVMDVRTGEVLALATAPTFDPDNRSGTPVEHFGNPAVSEVFEPGSVNKIITAAAALEAGVVSPQSVLTVPWEYKVGRHTVHDSSPHPVERLTFTGVLVKSSNVGTVQVAQRLGRQRMYDALRRFGFGERTGLSLPGESRGVVPTPKEWSGTSIATIPIGQGVSANVAQVASVYATVANGGVRVTPHLVRATTDARGAAVKAPPAPRSRVLSPEVAKQISLMLEGVVTEEGTAPLAAIPGYRVAGKTGTAQRVSGGRYDGSYTSSFVGYAPADAPRLVTAVVLQGTGKRAYYGGAVAGPVFKSVMSFALRSLQVPPTGTVAPTLRLQG
ncbi:MAG TPA: penicillin-binding protein 2 [Mycobacteriales bacterium]|nr:penicillin-binding protein 2 [Mycobacteriales bacterium]